jgi:hypothetical protein
VPLSFNANRTAWAPIAGWLRSRFNAHGTTVTPWRGWCRRSPLQQHDNDTGSRLASLSFNANRTT